MDLIKGILIRYFPNHRALQKQNYFHRLYRPTLKNVYSVKGLVNSQGLLFKNYRFICTDS